MDEVTKAKVAVLEAVFGICSLEESELLARLEELYWTGFKAGQEHGGSHVQPD